MSEIYWITRLGALYNLFAILASLAGIASIFLSLMAIMEGGDAYTDEDHKRVKKLWRFFKMATATCMVLILLAIFIPSKKDMLLIYGVGGTIDYLQDNPKAQKLPDKVIDCLDKYLDEKNDNE